MLEFNKLKLCALVSHPIQYYVPLYRLLATQRDIDFSVLFRTRAGVDETYDQGFGRKLSWDVPLLDGYKHQFLSEKKKDTGIEWGVIRALWNDRPDVLLIHGYNQATNIIALLASKIFGIKVLMRGDTRLGAHHKIFTIKSIFKRIIFKLIDGLVSVGSLNSAYYQYFGVSNKKLFFAPFSVNNDYFSALSADQAQSRKAWRIALELPENSIISFTCAKLIERKRTQDAILAFEKVLKVNPNIYLLIAGSGPEEYMLRNMVTERCISNVRFVGFLNQSQLPGFYSATDIFIFPSEHEPWGLGLNEVMAAGLPAIVSDDVGAAPDLVINGITGFIYPVGNIDQLAEALAKLFSSSELRQKMGAEAKNLIAEWNVTNTVSGMVKAAMSVAEK